MKEKVLKFKVIDIQSKENGGYYAKLFCEFVLHEGTLGALSQHETRQITYFYPMKQLADGVKVGTPKDMFIEIPHKDIDGTLHPVGFVVKTSPFKPKDSDKEIPCKWLFHV